MKEQDLEIIKNTTLVLKNGEKSGAVVLEDSTGEDMYLTFTLRYIGDRDSGTTNISSPDSQHADLVIEVRPNSITKPSQLIHIGQYEPQSPIYLGFVVQPQIGQSGEHNVVVTFYKGKEKENATDND